MNIKVAVLGTAGYTAKEVIELLLGHPEAEIVSLVSESQPEGTDIGDIWPRFRNQLAKATSRTVNDSCDVGIISKPASLSEEWTQKLLKDGLRVIDLSASFRLKNTKLYEQTYEKHSCPELIPEAVYGLSEIHRQEIAKTKLVANPGCYSASVILACYPLFENNLVEPCEVIVDSYSGISGAGKNSGDENGKYLYVERDENMTPYAVLTHRHTPEMEQELSSLANEEVIVTFVPHLAPLMRGIMTTIYLKPKRTSSLTLAKLRDVYESTYAAEPFVRLMPEKETPSLANVVGTNFCDVGLFFSDKLNRIVLVSAIDNLGKGAAGQAIQNMNIMFGLDETMSLMKANGNLKVSTSGKRWSDKPIFLTTEK